MYYHARFLVLIISAAMRLHKFCIENDGIKYFESSRTLFGTESEKAVYRTWWRAATSLRATHI